MTHGVYIHIPFCKRKCLYCDFPSWANCMEDKDAYVRRLIREIHDRAQNETVDSIFFGGGTPSVLPAEDLLNILHEVCSSFRVSDDAEITLEANPGTVDLDKLKELYTGGFNRISFGVQSLCDHELQALGRIHSAKDAEASITMAKEAGFLNINADVMLAIPYQTRDSLENTLSTLVQLGVSHISAYSLIIEEGTPFYEKTPTLPSEEEERELYWFAKKYLEEHGFIHYEISNFAKDGYASRHNCKYWIRAPYYGFGVAAHSFLNDHRFANVSTLDDYIKRNDTISDSIYIPPIEAENERLMLGFRMLCGVSCDAFDLRIQKLMKQGLLMMNEDRIKLTDRGLDLANLVFMEFV